MCPAPKAPTLARARQSAQTASLANSLRLKGLPPVIFVKVEATAKHVLVNVRRVTLAVTVKIMLHLALIVMLERPVTQVHPCVPIALSALTCRKKASQRVHLVKQAKAWM